MSTRRIIRLLAFACLLPYVGVRLAVPEHWDLLDDVDLAVHEAGHLLFGPLGDHPGVLGGSLFQLIVPASFVYYFLRRRDVFACGVTLTWLGVNLVNVSRYVGDAQVQVLPLLGGENTIHDWWYLLTEWDLLAKASAIASSLHAVGTLTFAGSLVLIALGTRRSEAETRPAVVGQTRSLLGNRR